MESTDDEDISVVVRGGASIVGIKPLLSNDNKYIIHSSGDIVKVLSVVSGECVCKLIGHTKRITGLAFNPYNQFQVYTCSKDGTVKKWEFTDGILIKTFNIGSPLLGIFPCQKKEYVFYGIHQAGRTNNSSCALVKFHLSNNVEGKVKLETAIPRIKPQINTISLGCKGSFVAAVNYSTLQIYVSKNGNNIVHNIEKEPPFSCVAAHPTEECVATGCSNGRILLWYNFVSTTKIIKRVCHWHAGHVNDLQYSTDGSYLLSGGQECVLVKWQHNTEHKDTMPRLGAPLLHIALSKDGTVYATSHTDNSIQIMSNNFKMQQSYQGLTRGYLDKTNKVRTDLCIDPRSKALVLNGRPGHLQFYDVNQDKQLYNLDIVCQNYISPDNPKRPLVFTEVENVSFDDSGDWFATIERRDDGKTAMEMKLKFWKFNIQNKSFVLNTCVDLPHEKSVHTLKFRPANVDLHHNLTLVTSSKDGKFKLWQLVDDSDIYRKNVCWSCESVGYYRDEPAGAADFSEDGSILAVAFGSALTLWDPDSNALRTSFTVDDKIRHVLFGKKRCSHLLMVSSSNSLIVWNLLSCSVLWKLPIKVSVMNADPRSSLIAVFTENSQVHLYEPSSCEAVYTQSQISSTPVISAVFVPHSDRQQITGLLQWQNKSRLYFMNDEQELLTIARISTEELENSTAAKLTQHVPSTPFSMLLAEKRKKENPQHLEIERQSHKQSTSFLKEILATPAHVMPSMDTLCQSFISTLMLKSSGTSAQSLDSSDTSDDEDDSGATDDDEDEKAIPDTDTDADMDTNENDGPFTCTRGERNFDSIKAETFSWIDNLVVHKL